MGQSESLHREAYNTMFREFEIDYRWDEEYYDQLQNKVGGGKPKMRYYFGENGWPTSTLGAAPTEEKGREDMLNALQNRKTDIYKDMIRGGTAQVRPGVLRLIEEARRLGEDRPKLAICSASTKSSCLFVLDNLLKPDVLQHFDLILAGDDVKHRKPDPEIYRLASERYGGIGIADPARAGLCSQVFALHFEPHVPGPSMPPIPLHAPGWPFPPPVLWSSRTA